MSENPTVLDLIREGLKTGGYDGLFNTRSGCVCLLGDLAPCGEFYGDCRAGYRVNYKRGECPCGLGCDFHIVPEKPTGPSVRIDPISKEPMVACPVCKRLNVAVVIIDEFLSLLRVTCSDCGTFGPTGINYAESVRLWNEAARPYLEVSAL